MYVEDLTSRMDARTLRKHRVRKGSEKAAGAKRQRKSDRVRGCCESDRVRKGSESDRVRKGSEKATACEKEAKATMCEKAVKKRPRASALRERPCARTLQKRLCAKSQRFSFFEMGLVAAGGLCRRFVREVC